VLALPVASSSIQFLGSFPQWNSLLPEPSVGIMAENKGNPSGREASKKTDPGRKRTSRERSGQSGAFDNSGQRAGGEHPAGDGGPEQDAGGPEHHGGDAHEDRNP
jgi:hypothetical protein